MAAATHRVHSFSRKSTHTSEVTFQRLTKMCLNLIINFINSPHASLRNTTATAPQSIWIRHCIVHQWKWPASSVRLLPAALLPASPRQLPPVAPVIQTRKHAPNESVIKFITCKQRFNILAGSRVPRNQQHLTRRKDKNFVTPVRSFARRRLEQRVALIHANQFEDWMKPPPIEAMPYSSSTRPCAVNASQKKTWPGFLKRQWNFNVWGAVTPSPQCLFNSS